MGIRKEAPHFFKSGNRHDRIPNPIGAANQQSLHALGINVLHCESDFKTLAPGLATSLRLEGVTVDCDQVLVCVLNELDICYTMARQDDKSRILKEWSLRQLGTCHV